MQVKAGTKIHQNDLHQDTCDTCDYQTLRIGGLRKHQDGIQAGKKHPSREFDHQATTKNHLNRVVHQGKKERKEVSMRRMCASGTGFQNVFGILWCKFGEHNIRGCSC